MLLPRFITALIGAPVLLLSIWWGQVPYFILIVGVAALALQEYFALAQEANWPVSPKMGMICGVALVLCVAFFGTKFDWMGASSRDAFFSAREAPPADEPAPTP
jgi:CDP-diglyceride synthetase